LALDPGSRLGAYEILTLIGSGGMGEVYRARDTRLDRVVAVKVLSARLSSEPHLRERFDREARAISSLNHPHICALYDVGDAGGARYFVMELIDGESLADRLLKGPLSVDQALQYAIEISDALSCAHRGGLVHRDVKPGNVMLTKTGAKLLDFGLAKSGPALKGADPHAETTWAITPSNLTAEGTLVGTFQYMSPEQLEGLDIDARADIFALGALLFEMLAGRKAFAGRTQTSLIGAILKDEPPPVSSLVAVTPPALDRVVRKCLAKDPDDRWQDAQDLRDELKWIAAGGGREEPARRATAAARRTREWLAWTLLAIALSALGASYFRTSAPAPVVRFALTPPADVTFAPAGAPVAPFPAVSPDGTLLVFVGNRRGEPAMLWLQRFDSLDARPLDGTTVRTDTLSPALPFWSPDSRSIGFFADGKLKRIDVGGGSPQVICDAPQSGGASWGADATIVFASKIDEGLRKVPASGGTPVQITKPDPARGEISHSNPAFLSDGRRFLFWVQAAKSSIRAGSIDSPDTVPVVEADSRAAYASGFVLFVRQSTLIAQAFDEKRLAVTGDPMPIADDVRTFPQNGRSAFSMSANGVLAYRTGSSAAARTLVWQDRQGKPIATVPGSPAMYGGISLGADDRHLVAQIEEGSASDLWSIDLEQGSRSRITSDPKSEGSPVLSPDDRFVVFASDRNGVDDLLRARADGAGDEQLLVKSGISASVRKYPTDWSAHWIAFTAFDSRRKQDLWVVDAQGSARGYLQTEFSERDGHLSPDERWMVYTSDEAGADAVYIRTFPEASGGKWRVSGAGGGVAARWRADGKEIFYADDRGQLTAVPVSAVGGSPDLGTPRVLFRAPPASRAGYAVSRDGSRFLLTVPSDDRSRTDMPLFVVLNWPGLLARR
jgi:eukaryotic-like serine/threonine-protein kinase